ncbi:hypothetical protein GOP47_0005837 [Adiantum capillus-veneris]|uniref:Uncharacterized protein n=1 Tax=Adiantum capillus-veneris TaxID=13818 RepID=A0A9D4V709_ADICA|nr:hypothetical protein GOP47_0005837 [Adiantum capillus-veneris]
MDRGDKLEEMAPPDHEFPCLHSGFALGSGFALAFHKFGGLESGEGNRAHMAHEFLSVIVIIIVVVGRGGGGVAATVVVITVVAAGAAPFDDHDLFFGQLNMLHRRCVEYGESVVGKVVGGVEEVQHPAVDEDAATIPLQLPAGLFHDADRY